jgi:hypothetical protein
MKDPLLLKISLSGEKNLTRLVSQEKNEMRDNYFFAFGFNRSSSTKQFYKKKLKLKIIF